MGVFVRSYEGAACRLSDEVPAVDFRLLRDTDILRGFRRRGRGVRSQQPLFIVGRRYLRFPSALSVEERRG